MAAGLDNHHRKTLEKLFEHPSSRNVEWRELESLLDAVGTVTKEHNGKLRVTVGPETEVFHSPHGKDVDVRDDDRGRPPHARERRLRPGQPPGARGRGAGRRPAARPGRRALGPTLT